MSGDLATVEPFSDEWVAEVVRLTGERSIADALSGRIGLVVGSKGDVDPDVVIEIDRGRVVGPSTANAEVVLPVSKKQLAAWSAGELSLTRAYVRGDLKPVGASGPLFAALEVLDWLTTD